MIPGMMKRDARRLSTEAQYELRTRAVKMLQADKSYREVSALLEVSTTALQNWMGLFREGGMAALYPKRRGRICGTARRLTARQEQVIQRLIADKDPEQLKLPFVLWTRPAVGELVWKRYGIRLPVRTLGEYLKRWGYTPQRPKKRAYEQQPEEVRRWLDTEYPAIERRAARENALILWGDETGVSNQDQRGRGYAPRGQTPVVRGMAQKIRVNMVSAVGNRGDLRFMSYKGSMKVATFIRFLGRLIRSSDQKVFFIVDNLRTHRSAAVRKWVAKRADQIELFHLPSYSPELNPDEYLNQAVKAQLKNRPWGSDRKGIHSALKRQMVRNQRNPKLVARLFEHPRVRYAAV